MAYGDYTGNNWSISSARGFTFDGTYFWVVNSAGTLKKYNSSFVQVGSNIDISSIVSNYVRICHDGTHLWVMERTSPYVAHKITEAGVDTGISVTSTNLYVTIANLLWNGTNLVFVGQNGACEERSTSGTLVDSWTFSPYGSLSSIYGSNYLNGNTSAIAEFTSAHVDTTKRIDASSQVSTSGGCAVKENRTYVIDNVSPATVYEYKLDAISPDMTVDSATDITKTTATLNGEIDGVGVGNATVRGFYYKIGTTGIPTASDNVVSETGNFTAGTYSLGISGLEAGTNLRVVAFATNSNGTDTSATIDVKLLSDKEVVSGTTGDMSATIESLDADTTYYIRSFATNSEGTAYGEETSFKTIKSFIPKSLIGN